MGKQIAVRDAEPIPRGMAGRSDPIWEHTASHLADHLTLVAAIRLEPLHRLDSDLGILKGRGYPLYFPLPEAGFSYYGLSFSDRSMIKLGHLSEPLLTRSIPCVEHMPTGKMFDG